VEFRNVGTSGLRVSAIGLGCNNLGGRLDRAASLAVVHAALEHGITLFDTADRYPLTGAGRSEELLGEALGARRGDVIVATKFGLPMDAEHKLKGASRRYIMNAVDASLRRLQTDYIDLYQLHTPDPLTPIDETLRALDDLVKAGKVRYVGCSNFAPWQITDASWTAKTRGFAPFVSMQAEYSLMTREPERELMPAMQSAGVGFLPYFPLASGLLTGKYRVGQAAPQGTRLTQPGALARQFMHGDKVALAERLLTFSEERGHTVLELAFSWLLQQPTMASVIAGASNEAQIVANVSAGGWQLTGDDLHAIDAIVPPPSTTAH
jgi:aryl-alcohol dehydrogenase-like predicted oxidoreductase